MRKVLITCEHASYAIPASFQGLFRKERALLVSHRGWDKGALPIAQALAKNLKAPLLAGKHSRLLIDLNRTADHKKAFSEFTHALSAAEKKKILTFHQAHWQKARKLARSRPLHIGVHSFVPVLHGHRRKTGIGILCDPARKAEYVLAKKWQKELRKILPYAIHLNLPYRGTGNGLTTALRTEFPAAKYLGIELEINQACLKTKGASKKIASALGTVIAAS